MTLVFKSETGHLKETQFSRTDVVATFSAAQSAWGWVGGLDGIRLVLKSLSLFVPKKFKENTGFRVPEKLELSPLAGQVFSEIGPAPYSIEDTDGRFFFGGDFATKLIGLSICAIAHECGGEQAVTLFLKCLAPDLFPQDGVNDTLHSILLDNHQKIICEGASRGLTVLFEEALARLNLPPCDRRWIQDKKKRFPLELSMVGGLLRWIGSGRKASYFTRSSMVARVAICLREVGYLINGVRFWDGIQPIHRLSAPDVILVVGGSSETDTMMLDDEELIVQYLFLHHYSFRTVGSMFSNSFFDQCSIPPESLQNTFEKIYFKIQDHLSIQWVALPFNSNNETRSIVRARMIWKPLSTRLENRPIATRLAGMNFPLLGDTLAFCYEGIVDNDNALQDILSFKKHHSLKTTTPNLVLFRAATASIVFSIAALFSGTSFQDSMHVTRLKLTDDYWLQSMCKCLDNSPEYMPLSTASLLLAAIHSAAEPAKAFGLAEVDRVIGWREGIYSVVPSLLLNMKADVESVGLKCVDHFWGNSITYDDGSVKAGVGSGIFEDENSLDKIEEYAEGVPLDVQSLRGPHLGPPIPGPPEQRLYIGLERALHYNSRDLTLRGRINGQPVGSVDIRSVLRTLILSLEVPQTCPDHSVRQSVFNIKTSVWADHERIKPIGGNFNSFIPVQGDHSWAVFLAGQLSTAFHGKIIFGCAQCAADSVEKGSLLIGFS